MREIYNRDTTHIGRVSKRKRKDRWLGWLTMCLMFFMGALGFAQEVGTIQIGSGTTATSASSLTIPVTNYDFSYSQFIITEAQYKAGGGDVGEITKIRFKVKVVGTLTNWNNWAVYIGNTNKANFTSNTDFIPVSNLVQVFNGVITPDPVAENWLEIIFSQPFNYTGGNIVVGVDENSLGWQSGPQFYTFVSSSDTGIAIREDGATNNFDPANLTFTSTSGRGNILPQVQFEGILVSCPPLNNVTTTAITANGATLNWVGSAESFKVEWGIAGFVQGNGNVVNEESNSHLLTGLIPNTSYDYYVKKVCGENDESSIAGPFTFKTACGPQSALTEGFELSATGTTLPTCWTRVIGGSGTLSISSTTPSTGVRSLYMSSSSTTNRVMAVFPEFSDISAGTHWLKFKARATVANKTFKIGYVSSVKTLASFVELQEVTLSTTTYGDFINFAAPTSIPAGSFLAILNPGTTSTSIYFDDFVWEPIPSCFAPNGLSSSNISATTATFGWTASASNPSNGYDIYYSTINTAPTAATNPSESNHDDVTISISDLTPATTYYWWVRSDCGSETSVWASGGSFTTLCDLVTTFSQNWDGVTATALPICFNKVGTLGTVNTQAGSASSGTNTLYIYGGSTSSEPTLALQPVSNAGAGTHWLKFKLRANFTVGGKLQVGYLTNPTDATSFVMIQEFIANSATTYEEFKCIPGTLPGSNTTLALRAKGSPANSMLVDDLVWELAPSCLPVTNLSVVHTLTSANLSWTASTSAPSEGYEWEVRTSGAAGSGNEGLVSSGTTAAEVVTATATGLVLNTNHTLYVRANCGGGDFSVWAASAPFYVGYCVPVTSSGCTDGDVIARVVLNTLDNNSGTGCPSDTLGYSNYTTDPALTTTLQAGNSYSCTVYAGEYSEGYAAWIDYNNDGVFDNVTERIGYSNGKVAGSGVEGELGSSASFPVVISCNPTPGNYRLRVRAMYNVDGINVTPCTANSFGETEDYMITISAAVACPQPNTLAVTAINAQGATLNWNAGCEETLWDVHVGLAGSGSPAGAPSDASVTQAFVKTGLNHSTQYEYWVRANCGSGSVSDWSGPFAFTTTCPTGIWTGTTNTDWNTASNWTDGVVPAACTAVSITAANAVVIPSEVTVASLSIGATANVTVNGILNVGNIAVANGGIFTVANNAVVLQTPTAVNTGVTTVNVNSANLYRQDYTLWSSPVAGQNLRNFSPQTLFNRFSSYDTALGTAGDYVQEIVTTADMNTKTFVNAKGYMIRMPNNWTQFVNTSIPGTPFLGAFTGTLNNGNVSIALSQANTKLNLVGNPYPSPISISAFFAANPDINEVLYFWRKRNDAAGSGYATYNAMGLVSVQSDVNGLDMNNTIKPGQGFFVQSNTATTLNFTNAMRTSSQGTFLRGASTTNELHRFWLNLSNTTGVVGQTLIGYATGATLGVDNGLDALYFNDSPLALTSLIDNNEYAIQGRSLPFTDTDIVPLGFKTDVAGSFTISLSNFDGLFADDQAIYLRDNTAGVVHNLKLSEYNFTTGSGIFNTRFEVLYSTTLGTNNPALTHNNILVGVKDQIIQINAGNVTMEKIELIDVSGRVIYTQDGVNATTATLENVVMNNQMLIVRISTKENGIVTQKIIF